MNANAWVHANWPTLAVVAVAVAAAIVAVVLAVQGRRAVRAVRQDMAARTLPEHPVAAAQVGQGRTFQIGTGLSMTITPLRMGIQLSVMSQSTTGAPGQGWAYPITDELAAEIAAKLTRRND